MTQKPLSIVQISKMAWSTVLDNDKLWHDDGVKAHCLGLKDKMTVS